MLRLLGADAVGMSTVLEAIAARWAGLEVAGVSLVTNPGAGYAPAPISHEDVLTAGVEAGPRLARVLRRFVGEVGPNSQGQASRSRRGAAATSRSVSMSVPGVRADVVAQQGAPGVLDAVREAGLDADALERLQRLGRCGRR